MIKHLSHLICRNILESFIWLFITIKKRRAFSGGPVNPSYSQTGESTNLVINHFNFNLNCSTSFTGNSTDLNIESVYSKLCVYMDEEGYWYMEDCNTLLPFICELPREGFTTLEPTTPTTERPGRSLHLIFILDDQ